MTLLRHALTRPAAMLAVLLVAVLGATLPGPSVAAAPPADTSVAARTGARAPAACADADYLWSHLARCGRAGPGNTGPRLKACPEGLTPMGSSVTGVIEIRQTGAQVTCRSVTGCLSVQASGVQIKNVRVRCSSGRTGEDANGTGAIKIENGASARIARTSIDGLKANHSCIWHEGASMVAVRVNCRGVNDGIFSWSGPGGNGNNFKIRKSYIHDLTTRTANGHVDGYQTEGASHGLISDNTFLMTSDAGGNDANAAIGIWNSFRDSTDIVVRGNLIAGGGFSVYAEDYSDSYDIRDVSFVDNVFSRRLFGCVGYFGVWFPRGAPTDGWHRSGNSVLETGASLDQGNPTYQGSPCI